MTDRDKLLNVISLLTNDYEEKGRSVEIRPSRTKIMFTEAGEIRSIIRAGKRYGDEK